MSEDLNEQRKAFSDKHGAVLLGMHRELKAMQSNIEESKQALENAQELSARANTNLTTQQTEFQNTKESLRVETKLWLNDASSKVQSSLNAAEIVLIRAQTMGKELEAKILENAELYKVRAQNLSNKVTLLIEGQLAELNRYKQGLNAQQLEVKRLHKESLTLLAEQKQREITHQLKVEQLNRTLNRIGLAIFSVLFIGIASIWVTKWMH